jgi:AraC-like DNA-binding protein
MVYIKATIKTQGTQSLVAWLKSIKDNVDGAAPAKREALKDFYNLFSIMEYQRFKSGGVAPEFGLNELWQPVTAAAIRERLYWGGNPLAPPLNSSGYLRQAAVHPLVAFSGETVMSLSIDPRRMNAPMDYSKDLNYGVFHQVNTSPSAVIRKFVEFTPLFMHDVAEMTMKRMVPSYVPNDLEIMEIGSDPATLQARARRKMESLNPKNVQRRAKYISKKGDARGKAVGKARQKQYSVSQLIDNSSRNGRVSVKRIASAAKLESNAFKDLSHTQVSSMVKKVSEMRQSSVPIDASAFRESLAGKANYWRPFKNEYGMTITQYNKISRLLDRSNGMPASMSKAVQ